MFTFRVNHQAMVVGNERAQEIIDTYFSHIQDGKEIGFPFLLLHGPEHIGKTTAVEEKIAELTGLFAAQDYRALYDLTEKMGKQHTLKVEVSDKDQSIKIDDETYLNLGARDIINRLSIAPAGDFKVVYLENIERMSLSAANALLKTLEEPLEDRLIVASTTNKEALLDTIISRAFVVDFTALTTQQVTDYLDAHYPELSDEMRQFLLGFSLGKIGLIDRFLHDNSFELEELADHFAALTNAIEEQAGLVAVYSEFTYFQQQGMRIHLCEALAFLGVEHDRYELTEALVNGYGLRRTPVNDKHIAFDIALGAS